MTAHRATAPPQPKRRATAGAIAGHAVVFNSWSQDLGDFIETVRAGAFTESLAAGAEVKCLVDHQSNLILGRTGAGTLRLREDSIGLKFECDVANTGAGRDAVESIGRHDLHQCSFAFSVRDGGERWYLDDDGGVRRELTNLSLMDTSIVTYPAYRTTTCHKV